MTAPNTMTLEAKIVQRIKEYGLHELVDDEDAIEELVKRAIQEALFQPVTVPPDYWAGYSKTLDKPAIVEARKVVAAAAKQLFEEMVADLLKDEKFRKAMVDAFITQLPDALKASAFELVQHARTEQSQQAIMTLQDMVRNGLKLGV